MTEQEWVQSSDDLPLLNYLDGKITVRKGRLFACASSGRLLPLFEDQRSRNAFALALRLADNHATEEECCIAYAAANEVGRTTVWQPDLFHCATFTLYDDKGISHWAAHADNVAVLLDESVCGPLAATKREMAELVRHIFGNPFRSYSLPVHWPSTVLHLVSALYNGQDCSFALHDALLEAGHAELAEHFSKEQWHPKGCWVLDLILGKK